MEVQGKGCSARSVCSVTEGGLSWQSAKLNPSRYTPEFVYDRVTNGFRGMPPFKEQFSEQELKAVTAFIMSKTFSN